MSTKISLNERLQQFVQLVVGLGAAGASHAAATAPPTSVLNPDADLDRLTHSQSLNADSLLMARGHRSHSSHSSHRSHSSHYSSSGGSGYVAPSAPAYTVPAPAPSSSPMPAKKSTLAPATPAPRSAPLYTMPGVDVEPPANATAKGVRTQDALRILVMRVQAALLLKNYDPGEVDGNMSAATIAALKKYQKDLGLKVTGTINAQTRDALALRASF